MLIIIMQSLNHFISTVSENELMFRSQGGPETLITAVSQKIVCVRQNVLPLDLSSSTTLVSTREHFAILLPVLAPSGFFSAQENATPLTSGLHKKYAIKIALCDTKQTLLPSHTSNL